MLGVPWDPRWGGVGGGGVLVLLLGGWLRGGILDPSMKSGLPV